VRRHLKLAPAPTLGEVWANERGQRRILLDCKVNADIAAPFMGEFAEFEARQHG